MHFVAVHTGLSGGGIIERGVEMLRERQVKEFGGATISSTPRVHLDSSFEQVVHVGEAPTGELLRRLGFSGTANTSWNEVVLLEPSRALPRMLAADLTRSDETSLREFGRAHEIGVLHGVLADRLDDGQAASAPDLVRIRSVLRKAWTDALGDALRDAGAAHLWTAAAERLGQAAVRREQRAYAVGEWTLDAYAQATTAHLWWAGLAAHGLLSRYGSEEQLRGFGQVFALLAASLQCTDDAFDGPEDKKLRGASMSDLLGIPTAALGNASWRLCMLGENRARWLGFTELAEWFRGRADEVARRVGNKPGFAAELAGLALAGAFADRLEWIPRFPHLTPLRH